MLRITQQSSADAAKSYYTSADDYSEGQEVVGRWGGEGARLLGLEGQTSRREDPELLDAFGQSVRETMADVEVEMKARVRKKDRNEEWQTGNLAYAEFVHFTSRPVAGVPDPQLDARCFVFNATWDGAEGQWKAGEPYERWKKTPEYALWQKKTQAMLDGK